MAQSSTPAATAAEPGCRIDRTSPTASADDPAPVPTQTIRVTPASEARAMMAARRVAWGPALVDPGHRRRTR